MVEKLLFETPEAVTRQGEALFLKCPLYRATKAIQPIYINKELFRRHIANIEASWEQMSAAISELFAVTLQPEESSGEQIGWAYVDRQSDPLALSLSGNEGSGRAYYTGKNFNIKGEKTPLATSTEINHSNGVLAMHDGIWCSLIANSLYPDCKVSPVLAILDLNEDYTHPEKLNKVRRVKLIRLDLDGSLDRITHLFYLHKLITRDQFLSMAGQFGQLDAHKFMQRIVHGSWSNGNISPQGHLIDYDTVCAVKGRQPQFSRSSYYIDNYFSFEYVGKLKVLESLAENQQINIEQIKLSALKDELIAARDKEIAVQLLYLMGFDSTLFNRYATELNSLAELLKKLSTYVRYNRERSFFTNSPFHFFAHIFDFSNFFRYFPLLKLKKHFDLDTGFALLVESELIPEDETTDLFSNFIEEPLEPRVLAYLQDCFISNEEQIIQLKKEAYEFIEKFNTLFDDLLANSHLSLLNVVKKAYQLNEDRFYLFPVFDLSTTITKLALTEPTSEINALIEQLIAISRRLYQEQTFAAPLRTDTRLFVEGQTYIELTNQGSFQIVFELNKSLVPDLTDLTITYNGNAYKASWSTTAAGAIKITSLLIDLQELFVPYPRDEVFKLRKYELLSKGNPVRPQDYFGVDQKLQYYL